MIQPSQSCATAQKSMGTCCRRSSASLAHWRVRGGATHCSRAPSTARCGRNSRSSFRGRPMPADGRLARLAGNDGCEAVLAQRLVPLPAAGALPDLEHLRFELAPRLGLSHRRPPGCLNSAVTTICWRPHDGCCGTVAADPYRVGLPTVKRLLAGPAEQSNKEGWPAERFLAAVMEHELAERETERLERYRLESQM
jgi:hypothetical protein